MYCSRTVEGIFFHISVRLWSKAREYRSRSRIPSRHQAYYIYRLCLWYYSKCLISGANNVAILGQAPQLNRPPLFLFQRGECLFQRGLRNEPLLEVNLLLCSTLLEVVVAATTRGGDLAQSGSTHPLEGTVPS